MAYEPPVIQYAQSTLTNLNGVGTAFITTVIAQPAGSTANTVYIFAPTSNPNGKQQNQWYELPPIQSYNNNGDEVAPPIYPNWNFFNQYNTQQSSQGNT